ncbi:Na+/H+ antiporter subunit E [Daeguia caeni]|uniref:Na+/H+ antiporter subunit E n=1 Tax=Daeguia caeni TaxID=439612 RepID=A0ABV9H508_9HYPH
MRRLLPYPLLFVALLIFWLLLNGFSRGQFLIGLVVSLVAGWIMTALEPEKNHLRSMPTMLALLWEVVVDIIRSNIAVARLVLSPRKTRTPGFVTIPLDLENKGGLAILSCIITATPGTAWVDYNAARHELTIHVLDLEEEQYWRDSIKSRYEKPLIAIFGKASSPEPGKEKSA